jgi:hypothetical protein
VTLDTNQLTAGQESWVRLTLESGEAARLLVAVHADAGEGRGKKGMKGLFGFKGSPSQGMKKRNSLGDKRASSGGERHARLVLLTTPDARLALPCPPQVQTSPLTAPSTVSTDRL